MIICDSKEKKIIDYLQLLKANYAITHIPHYDFRIGNFRIERKTWKDFQASIIDGRLATTSRYANLIIIEKYGETKISVNSILGMLAKLISRNISIVFVEDSTQTAKFLMYLDQKVKNPVSIFYIPKVKKTNTQELKLQILSLLPGISSVRANKILKNFKSIKEFINSPPEEKEKFLPRSVVKKIEDFLTS